MGNSATKGEEKEVSSSTPVVRKKKMSMRAGGNLTDATAKKKAKGQNSSNHIKRTTSSRKHRGSAPREDNDGNTVMTKNSTSVVEPNENDMSMVCMPSIFCLGGDASGTDTESAITFFK